MPSVDRIGKLLRPGARHAVVLGLAVTLLWTGCVVGQSAVRGHPPVSIGFGVAVPSSLPSAWSNSFSYLTTELFLSLPLTAVIDFGTYPHDFPDRFEAAASLQAKAWLGPICPFTGGGLAIQLQRVGSAWALRPHLVVRAGVQLWPVDAVVLALYVRSLEPLPLSWTFSPELCASLSVVLGPARPSEPIVDVATLWFVLGTGVAAAVLFLPRI